MARNATWWRRFVAYPLQALGVNLAFGFFALLPVDAASALGGWIARLVGPRLSVSGTARRNLARVFPELDAGETATIIEGMWDNLGRTAAEHAHLADFDPYRMDSRVEIVGAGIVDLLRDDMKPGMFFTGHLANWELAALGMTRRGLPVHVAYRAANNRLVDKIFQRRRGASGTEFFAKGVDGAKHALKTLGEGGHVAMLVDQKMNDGIAVPLLGIDAMTAPALAQLAIKFDCPVVPTRVERLKGARFRLTFYPPLEAPGSGDKQADIQALMLQVNDLLGQWIRERPEQWLWVHNRWPPV